MIVSWEFYTKRKRINVKKWLDQKNINSYKELADITRKLGIEPPPDEKVSKYFENQEVSKNDKKIKKSSPVSNTSSSKVSKASDANYSPRKEAKVEQKPTQTKKRTRRKRKPIEKEDK